MRQPLFLIYESPATYFGLPSQEYCHAAETFW